jgi:hypothetical protein
MEMWLGALTFLDIFEFILFVWVSVGMAVSVGMVVVVVVVNIIILPCYSPKVSKHCFLFVVTCFCWIGFG